MSGKCGNCNCADSTQCVNKGNQYGFPYRRLSLPKFHQLFSSSYISSFPYHSILILTFFSHISSYNMSYMTNISTNSSSKTFPYILIILILITIFPQKSLQDYVCPYPCLPPPTAGGGESIPTPVLPPPPKPPTTTPSSSNCPPPPSPPVTPSYVYSSPPPPSSSGQYYFSPPPPSSGGYTPGPPSYGYYPPPSGSMFPYGNAPPPPNPIVPYFPYYFKNPPPSPQDISSATMNMMNKFQLLGSLWSVLLLLSSVAFLGWR